MFDVNGPGIAVRDKKYRRMADDRVAAWALAIGAAEMRSFMRARRRFLKRPSAKHVRELRTAARRLRAVFEDFRDLLPPRKPAALARLITLTGEARRVAVLQRMLREAIDARERNAARPLLQELRERERRCVREVRRRLATLRYRP